MARKTDRAVIRAGEEFNDVVNKAKGDYTARGIVDDIAQEKGVARHTGEMMMMKFQVGTPVFLETQNWAYVGIINEVGTDYIVLEKCVRVISDGRHHIMMRTGTADGIEMEPSGGPSGLMCIPVDWIGPWCVWPFTMPHDAI